jgi:hypothetical protein
MTRLGKQESGVVTGEKTNCEAGSDGGGDIAHQIGKGIVNQSRAIVFVFVLLFVACVCLVCVLCVSCVCLVCVLCVRLPCLRLFCLCCPYLIFSCLL